MAQLFVILLIAHFVGDFTLQPKWLCDKKMAYGFRSWALYVHGMIIMTLSWLMVFRASFFCYAFLIGVSHIVIDGLKAYLAGCVKKESRYKNLILFSADQFAHVILLAAVSCFAATGKEWFSDWFVSLDGKSIVWPLFIFGLIVCTKPANILVKYVLETIGGHKEDDVHAGEWIGTLERTLSFLFVILGKYEAVGLVYAAKTILRYKDTETHKTEYVLVGTLMSLLIAIVCGLMVIKGAALL